MKKESKNKKTDKKPFFFKRSRKVVEKSEDDEAVREVIVERDNGFNTVEVIVIILISILFGVVVGYILSSTRTFGTAVSDEVTEIITTYDSILDNYYEDVDASELADAAVSGMISILDDPYSVYMDSTDTDSFLESVNGSFVGIGVTVEWSGEGIFKIVDVIDNSPAEDAGLKQNDIILKIDDEEVGALTLDELSNLIKGKSGTKVAITVLRGEEEVRLTVKRGVVEIPSVESSVIDDDIGYILIDSFSATTSEQFNKQLKNLEDKDIKSLIIDVRDNPGGKLGQVNKVLDNFFNKKTILYKIVTKDKTTNIYADNSDKMNIPVVVLVNHESASAAEILAACFQDNYDNATIVGSVTYGKGTIQKAVELSSGASIKYTTQKWLTPKGKWINEKGIIPDEVVNQGDEYSLDASYENDLQLQKAVEILKK